jgi:hypothetical protein
LKAGGDLSAKVAGLDLLEFSRTMCKHQMVKFLLKRATWPLSAALDEAKGARDL